MRTTLNIEDDVFFEAQNRAYAEKRSIGSVVSDLVRRALESAELTTIENQSRTALDAKLEKLGVIPYYAAGRKTVSNAMVNKLKNELEI